MTARKWMEASALGSLRRTSGRSSPHEQFPLNKGTIEAAAESFFYREIRRGAQSYLERVVARWIG
jgi:hypothetical protein